MYASKDSMWRKILKFFAKFWELNSTMGKFEAFGGQVRTGRSVPKMGPNEEDQSNSAGPNPFLQQRSGWNWIQCSLAVAGLQPYPNPTCHGTPRCCYMYRMSVYITYPAHVQLPGMWALAIYPNSHCAMFLFLVGKRRPSHLRWAKQREELDHSVFFLEWAWEVWFVFAVRDSDDHVHLFHPTAS